MDGERSRFILWELGPFSCSSRKKMFHNKLNFWWTRLIRSVVLFLNGFYRAVRRFCPTLWLHPEVPRCILTNVRKHRAEKKLCSLHSPQDVFPSSAGTCDSHRGRRAVSLRMSLEKHVGDNDGARRGRERRSPRAFGGLLSSSTAADGITVHMCKHLRYLLM